MILIKNCIFFKKKWAFRERMVLDMLTKLTLKRGGGGGVEKGAGGGGGTDDIGWQRGKVGLDPQYLAYIIFEQPINTYHTPLSIYHLLFTTYDLQLTTYFWIIKDS